MRRRTLLALTAGTTLAGCDSLLFYPSPNLPLDPARLGLAYRDVTIETSDGVHLQGWFLPSRGPQRGTVLFFHGNAQNIGAHLPNVAWLPDQGFSVLLFDYRGFGRSQGKPTLEGVGLDGEAALRQVFGLAGVDPDRVVVFGQSLGAAIAISALARSPERTKISRPRRRGCPRQLPPGGPGKARHPLAHLALPGAALLDHQRQPPPRRRYPPPGADAHPHHRGRRRHGHPPRPGGRAFSAARPPKTFWEVPGADHIQAMTVPANRTRLVAWIEGCAFGGSCPERIESES